MVTQACDLSTQEAKAGGSPVQGQPGLYISKQQRQNNKKIASNSPRKKFSTSISSAPVRHLTNNLLLINSKLCAHN
jgi:hypothetical protein